MGARVSDLLDRKGHAVVSCKRTASVHDAVGAMAANNIGCVLVTTRDGDLSGICSERDVFRKVVLSDKSPEETRVCDVMTPKKKLVTVRPDDTLQTCMELISKKRIRHLPVTTRAGKVQGIISIGDVVKTLSSEKDLMIRQLEHYISASL